MSLFQLAHLRQPQSQYFCPDSEPRELSLHEPVLVGARRKQPKHQEQVASQFWRRCSRQYQSTDPPDEQIDCKKLLQLENMRARIASLRALAAVPVGIGRLPEPTS